MNDDHRNLHVLPHSFPTQRSSGLFARGETATLYRHFILVVVGIFAEKAHHFGVRRRHRHPGRRYMAGSIVDIAPAAAGRRTHMRFGPAADAPNGARAEKAVYVLDAPDRLLVIAHHNLPEMQSSVKCSHILEFAS